MIPDCDGRTVGRSDRIYHKTALCIASYADALSKIGNFSLTVAYFLLLLRIHLQISSVAGLIWLCAAEQSPHKGPATEDVTTPNWVATLHHFHRHKADHPVRVRDHPHQQPQQSSDIHRWPCYYRISVWLSTYFCSLCSVVHVHLIICWIYF